MNLTIPRWLHVVILCVLAVLAVLTRLLASGDLATTLPLASIFSMITLLLQSVDKETAAKIIAKAGPTLVFLALAFGALHLMGCKETAAQKQAQEIDAANVAKCFAAQIAADDFSQQASVLVPQAIAACFPSIVVNAGDALWIAVENLFAAHRAGVLKGKPSTAIDMQWSLAAHSYVPVLLCMSDNS